jgi:hypothetical protein
MPGMILKEHTMDFSEALTKGSNAIETTHQAAWPSLVA